MEFQDAATFFDNDPLSDGYSGAYLFDGQTASFNDASSDGATNRRRILSLAPGLAIPARSVISMYGDRWIVGLGTPDGFQGDVVRQHFSMKRVTDLFAVLTPGQAVSAAAGVSAYAQKMYFKDTVNTLTDSEYDSQWNIFLSPGEPVVKGSYLRAADGTLYRVRNEYMPLEGLRLAQSDMLDSDAIAQAVFGTGAFNEVTDTWAAGTATVNAIKLDAPKFYRFRYVSDPKMLPGDLAVMVPSGTNVLVNQTFTMSGGTWRVEGKQGELDCIAVHARLA